MSTHSCPITLHMIRENSTSVNDDKLVIRKNLQDDTYTLWFTDTNSETQAKVIYQTLESMTQAKVLEHMRVLIKSIAFDEEGFIKVQFDIPGMPRILMSVCKMREVYYRDHIADLIETGLDAMDHDAKPSYLVDKTPEAKKRHCCSPPVCRNLYFDDE